MTEHESPIPTEPAWPPRAPETAPAVPQLEALEGDRDRAALREAQARLQAFEQAAGGYGPAFLAYLELDLPDPAHGSEVTDFLERFVGSYPDRQTFIRAHVDETGWNQAVALFKAEQGIWSDDLIWNQDTLWEHLSETYGLVEQFGGVYVFRR